MEVDILVDGQRFQLLQRGKTSTLDLLQVGTFGDGQELGADSCQIVTSCKEQEDIYATWSYIDKK